MIQTNLIDNHGGRWQIFKIYMKIFFSQNDCDYTVFSEGKKNFGEIEGKNIFSQENLPPPIIK